MHMPNIIIKILDLDQSTFSPPEHDDTFLYIRHPRQHPALQTTQDTPPNKYSPITDLLERTRIGADYAQNHTKPCQQYINGAAAQSKPPQVKIVKSSGVDDGFKGEGAACGTSVVRVAHQMVVSRGFNPVNATPIPEDDVPASPPVGWDPSRRRGSKSAPSSPVNPRKQNGNKYFTGVFTDGAVEKYQGSWILSGLLGKRETLSKSVNTLTEEENVEAELPEKKKSTSGQIFRARPSELREMNFWSPTSM